MTLTAEQNGNDGEKGNISFDDVVREELGVGHNRQPVGLAFSGGGIRSATFHLGLIQGLARSGVLDKFDYLSTVSGGGYIGAWLVSWAKRSGGIANVQHELKSHANPVTEPAPVAWLRRYSNYLTPRKGLLSLDTLTGVTYHVRNVFLSTLTIALFSFGLASLFSVVVNWFASSNVRACLSILGPLGGGFAAMLMWYCLPLVSGEQRTPMARVHNVVVRHWQVIAIAVLFVLSVFCWSLSGGYLPDTEVQPEFTFYRSEGRVFGFGYLLFSLAGMLLAKGRSLLEIRRSGGHSRFTGVKLRRLIIPLVLTSFVFGLYGGIFANLGIIEFANTSWYRIWLSAGIVAPISCFVVGLIISIHLGMAGRALASEAHFWISRASGVMVQLALGLCILPVAFLVVPPFFDWLQATAYVSGFGAIYLVVARWLASSTQTGKAGGEVKRWTARIPELVVQAAPYILTAVLVGLTATAVRNVYFPHDLALDNSSLFSDPRNHTCKEQAVLSAAHPVEADSDNTLRGAPEKIVRCIPTYGAEFVINLLGLEMLDRHKAFWGGMLALLVSLLLSVKIDANLFSLHTYYRNRLTNAYLAASTKRDRRNFDTGINPEDSLFLEELDQGKPYLLINTTLNLCGEKNDLSWQDRKAMSFVFSQKYCGFDLMAEDGSMHANYMPTKEFASDTGEAIKLNLPMTISGAAASPLAGYHTKPGISIMLALLGARLGWWFPNPAISKLWNRGMQKAPLLPTFFNEMFGQANIESKKVYLSDGGHFENLGIYELVKRRCALIVSGDSSADPEFRFDDLANAIHKIRVDFGIEIEINPADIRPAAKASGDDAAVRFSAKSFVVGKIRYCESRLERFRDLPDGVLIYVKSSLPQGIETDARDVWYYAASHSDFPHEPTSDQWFSEEQFEAYRKLGSVIGLQVAKETRFPA